jgi:UDP-N-acetylmuramate: L-alanyl-gamma-D-glutamyl-meso-diaminopimelate ligase
VNSIAGEPSFVIGSSTGTSFIVDKSGNVGVGTVSPTQKLELGPAGGIKLNSLGGTYGVILKSTDSFLGLDGLAIRNQSDTAYASMASAGFFSAYSTVGNSGGFMNNDFSAYRTAVNVSDTGTIVTASTGQYGWSPLTGFGFLSQTNDTGLARLSAGAVKVTDGSTGFGNLVAGTHGKTTTSALLTHVFINSGNEPAYMIGGVFQNSKDSYSIGSKKSKYVIYEGDEYNSAFFDRGPKFLRYNPSSIILTSIEHDHFDLYPSFQDYKQAFQFLVDDIPKGGFLVLHDSVLKYIDTKKTKGKVFTYGKDQKSDFYFIITSIDQNGTAFDIKSKKFGTIKNIFVPMFGEYNVENTLSVIALSLLEGVSKSKIIIAISTFSGTKQRQELIGQKKNGVIVVRDYAHHPTAVRLTIDGLKLHYPDKRLVVVFEPRSNSSRRKIFESGYTNALEKADVTIVVSPPFLADKDSKSDFMDVSVIQKELESKGKKSFAPKNCTEALLVAVKTQKKDDIFVFMSSGDFEGIPDKFLGI